MLSSNYKSSHSSTFSSTIVRDLPKPGEKKALPRPPPKPCTDDASRPVRYSVPPKSGTDTSFLYAKPNNSIRSNTGSSFPDNRHSGTDTSFLCTKPNSSIQYNSGPSFTENGSVNELDMYTTSPSLPKITALSLPSHVIAPNIIVIPSRKKVNYSNRI